MAGTDDRWWRAYAKCRGLPPDYFFPVVTDEFGLPVLDEEGKEKPDLPGVQAAKNFCNGHQLPADDPCPVRKECLHWAIVHGQWEGIYGGMVERDRREYAKRRRAGIGFRSSRGVEAPTRQRQI